MKNKKKMELGILAVIVFFITILLLTANLENLNSNFIDSEKKRLTVFYILIISVGLIYIIFYKAMSFKIKNARKELLIERQRYKILSENFAEVILDWDIEAGTVFWGEQFRSFFNSEPPTGNFPYCFKENYNLGGINPDELFGTYKNIMEGSPFEYAERNFVDKNNEFKWYSVSVTSIFDDRKKVIRAIGIIREITEQKNLEEKLKIAKTEFKDRLAKDPLTGLYNKVATEELIDVFLKKNSGNSQNHAFLMIDVDDFKAINDNLGHAFGDEVISEISRSLKGIFRETDIVGRIGGDEFVVFMKNLKNVNEADKKAEEICRTFARKYEKQESSHNISSSIGICLSPIYGTTYKELYKNADKSLYTAKRRGKNTYSHYDSN
ncbi:MAG: sensor domain-containing diguanylate cyclase [Proteocatella sp.]